MKTGAQGKRGQRSGYSMLDLAIGIMIVVVAVGSVSSSLTSGFSLNRSNRERSRAAEHADRIIEGLLATDFEEVFARYNATAADDPVDGVSPGATFDVPGLTPQNGDADGIVGEIDFPGDGVSLREDTVDRGLGMPRDLNGDGDELDDAAADYLVLPVRLRVAWQSTGGPQQIELVTTVARR